MGYGISEKDEQQSKNLDFNYESQVCILIRVLRKLSEWCQIHSKDSWNTCTNKRKWRRQKQRNWEQNLLKRSKKEVVSEALSPEDELLDALFAKQKQRFKIEEDAEKADDELDFEASANKFTEALRQGKTAPKAGKSESEKPKSERKQDVYLDKTTGKIIVNPRKSDHLTGVKRAINRRDHDADPNDDTEVGLQARTKT